MRTPKEWAHEIHKYNFISDFVKAIQEDAIESAARIVETTTVASGTKGLAFVPRHKDDVQGRIANRVRELLTPEKSHANP